MAYDDNLADRVRKVLPDGPHVSEKKMFGGLCFLIGGHMCCGINGDQLMLRIGPNAYEEALARPHAREMDFTGRSLKGFVYVAQEGLATEEDLADWVGLAAAFAGSLPPK
ncbi:MAG: TfoX/Sxy family protein [Gemmatimonadota bacterium]|nr:TfoX/Sxy family protein [Gemmatimonadota bacterium]